MSDPIAELREAARLMRQRAARVPHPWAGTERQIYPAADPMIIIAQSGVTEWADYLLSWHPDVALAVADLLENCAGQAEQSGLWMPDALSPGPLAVARAYLGGETQ